MIEFILYKITKFLVFASIAIISFGLAFAIAKKVKTNKPYKIALIFNIIFYGFMLIGYFYNKRIALSVNAKEPTYITVFDNEKNTTWYRDDVIVKDGNVSLIMGILIKKTAQFGMYNTEYNCASRRWITNFGRMMDRDGKIIYEQNERDEKWQPVAPNSTYERILVAVCKN